MATSGTFRVTGPVLSSVSRKGISKKGEPYAFHTLTVLVGGKGTSEVVIHDDSEFLPQHGESRAVPQDGDSVDFTVAIRCNQFGLNVTAIDIYKALVTAGK